MDFSDFVRIIPKIKSALLPGEEAHAIMSPPERRAIMQSIDLAAKKLREAAVLMLIYPRNNKACIALMLRNTYPGVHSAQISFPGGKKESADKSFAETAVRETFEEIGISKNQFIIVREFSRVYIPPSNFLVHPFLAYSRQELIFRPAPSEVSGIIELPLENFLDEASVRLEKRATSYSQSIDVKGFSIGDHYIWGATAMMLSELKEVLKSAL